MHLWLLRPFRILLLHFLASRSPRLEPTVSIRGPTNLDVNLLPGRAVGGAGVEPEPEPQPAEPEEPEPQPAEPKARPRGIIYVVHLHVCYKKLT